MREMKVTLIAFPQMMELLGKSSLTFDAISDPRALKYHGSYPDLIAKRLPSIHNSVPLYSVPSQVYQFRM